MYKSISDIFGYLKYFGLGRVRFWFSRYQNFEPVRIFNQFRFGLCITFSDRVWFGSSDLGFLPSLRIYIYIYIYIYQVT